jgi:hypothetical protein
MNGYVLMTMDEVLQMLPNVTVFYFWQHINETSGRSGLYSLVSCQNTMPDGICTGGIRISIIRRTMIVCHRPIPKNTWICLTLSTMLCSPVWNMFIYSHSNQNDNVLTFILLLRVEDTSCNEQAAIF